MSELNTPVPEPETGDDAEPTLEVPTGLDGPGDPTEDESEPTAVLPDVPESDVGEPEGPQLEESTSGVLAGPMRIVTLAVALGWFVLAVFGFWQISPPGGWVIGGLGLVGAVVTAWLGLTMVVRWDADGIVLPGRGHTPWSEIDQVSLLPGVLAVPQVELHAGRAIETIPLDALAWFGKGRSLRLARQVADHVGTGEVRVIESSRRRGSRAAD